MEEILLKEAEEVRLMTEGSGWRIVKEKLDSRILDLQSIANLDMEKPETLGIQLAARNMAVSEMYAWLKNDVYGFIEQQNANTPAPAQGSEEFMERI